MKRKINFKMAVIYMLTIFALSITNVIAQEKTKKQLKEEKQLEKQKRTEVLVNSKDFVFVASRVMPQGGRSINLTSDYTIEFHPDVINCDLPFYGRAYSGAGYGGDGGMKFEGKPTVFSIEKNKKGYLIKAEVKGERDSYFLMLTVYFEGSANLTINSNNRSSISYDGDIKSVTKK